MKPTTLLAALCSILPALNAHWIYPILSVNGGEQSKGWQYVRKLGPGPYASPDESGVSDPHRDIYSEDIRCGRGSFASAKATETLLINAGDEITYFAHGSPLKDIRELRSLQNTLPTMTQYHPGAAQVYLSKAETGDLETYNGDGDWFKIKNIGTTDGKTWDLLDKDSLNVTIPKATPPGKYLLKVEYIAYHQPNRVQAAEFFLSCTHVEIKGSGGGTPGPLVKIPGAYDAFDRSIWRPFSMGYQGTRPGDNYKNPGPEIWTG